MPPMRRTEVKRPVGKRPVRITGLAKEPTPNELDAALKSAGIRGKTFSPIQLHAFILKLVLGNRITNKELKLVTETYQELARHYWCE